MDSRKALVHVEIKSADQGKVRAQFATFNEIDKDGDVTLPGAFEDGAEVVVSSYGHGSWEGALPVGMGKITTTSKAAILDAEFFMDTASGRDTFNVIKRLGRKQEWSYGFKILESERGTHEGEDVQFLKRLEVFEVSPVLRGAGVGTRTLAVKAKKRETTVSPYSAAIRPHETRVTTKRWDATEVVGNIADDATVDDLRAVHAYVDPGGDPTLKSSYGFPHHHGVGGDANLRACLAGIAVLNGGTCDLGDSERKAVYDHLAQHLFDGDREVPELRTQASGDLKFHEEAAGVLAALDGLIVRTSEVMALRRSKGKAIASASVDILEWVYDNMRRLRGLLDSPQEDADREYARFIASQLQSPEGT